MSAIIQSVAPLTLVISRVECKHFPYPIGMSVKKELGSCLVPLFVFTKYQITSVIKKLLSYLLTHGYYSLDDVSNILILLI